MCNLMSSCVRLGAGHFPVVLMVLMVITLTMTYILAVTRRDVDPYFPYISDAGNKRPESCVFGQLLNIGAFLGIIIIYLRYRLVKELNRGSDLRLDRLNVAALIFGCLSSCGMSIVGNFQESAVLVVHVIGAFVCFGNGLTYSILQSAASYRMCPLYNGISICRLRLFISIIGLAAFLTSVTTGGFAAAAHHKHGKQWHDDIAVDFARDYLLIKKNEPGYLLHMISAISEWVLAVAMLLFLMTFSRDFEKMRVTVAVEPLVAHLDEMPPIAPDTDVRTLLNVST